jgi:ectoine hydroxylase-related dioxygenase (phytanoyl-CoA dioxygenase family)
MNQNSWKYSIDQKEEALSHYQRTGVVGFHDLLNSESLKKIHTSIDEAIENGDLKYENDKFEAYQNDIIFCHSYLEKIVNDKQICNITKSLIGSSIELQHSKFAIKPKKNKTSGGIKWHQDFPFFPHTNFDLIACAIHLDDEKIDSGPLKVIPQSHELGLLSHSKNDEFVYHCTDEEKIDENKSIPLICNAGDITFHNCLTLHSSEPKKNNLDRRLIVFQYRAQDALQLSGAIWKSTGYQVEKNTNSKVRFPNGLSIENRGINGRLYDIYGKLKPDEQKKSVSISYSD